MRTSDMLMCSELRDKVAESNAEALECHD
ncbi:hypothetical protein DSL72_009529 [Monilinia vaccinii-corymbosi]|uniref:Uncharacterized protein n=1 Tax=Monilinia vaccinii-corymbosi TaxID=61207 RepID=A0A8A3PRG3_9HELO|nr:hypothetical protein DSL72_009529 [Monilinia vaccinii-corymbosi]